MGYMYEKLGQLVDDFKDVEIAQIMVNRLTDQFGIQGKESFTLEEIKLAKTDRIKAIKLFRARTKSSLEHAKNQIDTIVSLMR